MTKCRLWLQTGTVCLTDDDENKYDGTYKIIKLKEGEDLCPGYKFDFVWDFEPKQSVVIQINNYGTLASYQGDAFGPFSALPISGLAYQNIKIKANKDCQFKACILNSKSLVKHVHNMPNYTISVPVLNMHNGSLSVHNDTCPFEN